MNGLILQLSALRAIVLLPGGEMVRVRRRRGWRVGMEVDPHAAVPLFGRTAMTALMAVLVLAIGIGGFTMLSNRGQDYVVTAPADEGLKLISIEGSLSPSVEETLYPSAMLLPSDEATLEPSVSPSPTAPAMIISVPTQIATHAPAIIQTAEPTPQSTDRTSPADDDDNDDDDDDDDRYERCDYCGKIGHDDDDCPNRKKASASSPSSNATRYDEDDDDDD